MGRGSGPLGVGAEKDRVGKAAEVAGSGVGCSLGGSFVAVEMDLSAVEVVEEAVAEAVVGSREVDGTDVVRCVAPRQAGPSSYLSYADVLYLPD